MDKLRLFCGQSNVRLAVEMGKWFGATFDVPCVASRFNDGEPKIRLTENVRGMHVALIQSTNQPGDNLVELLAMIDAAKRASAGSITVVTPYFGYAREDKKVKPRMPITPALICKLLKAAGADRVVSVDLHAGQIQGFFDGPFDNLEALPVLLRQVHRDLGIDFTQVAFVSPDDNGVERCRETGKLVNCGLVTFFMKGRDQEGNLLEGGVIRDIDVVRDRDCLLIDDMIDSGGSIEQAAIALKTAGAKRIIAVCVHPVLSFDRKKNISAQRRIGNSPVDYLYVSDTIQLPVPLHADEYESFMTKVRVVSVAPFLAEAISVIHRGDSVNDLFKQTCAEILKP